MYVLHVESQPHVALLLIARKEIDGGERTVFGHVEALELRLLQLQRLRLGLHLALLVHLGGHVLHLVGVARGLSFLVELEDIDIVIVPVIDEVAEVDALRRVFHAPYVDGHHVAS